MPHKTIEDRRAYKRAWDKKHPEELKKYKHDWFLRKKARDPEWYERRQERARQYYYEHREQILNMKKKNIRSYRFD